MVNGVRVEIHFVTSGTTSLDLGKVWKTLWCKGNLFLYWHYSHFFSACWIFGLNEGVLYGDVGMGSGWVEGVWRTPWVWVLFTKECEWVWGQPVTNLADCHGFGKLAVRHIKCCPVQAFFLPQGHCPSCCYSGGIYGWLHAPPCSVCLLSLTEEKEALCAEKQVVPKAKCWSPSWLLF